MDRATTGSGAGDDFAGLTVAVLIAAFDAADTIGPVLGDIRRALPGASLHVFDAGSSDDTARRAALAGARVHRESRRAGGQVMRHLLSEIDADIYVLASADGSTKADDLPSLVMTLVSERADMAVAVPTTDGFGAQGLRDSLLARTLAAIFGENFADPSARTRAFTRRFAKSYPGLGRRFRIETELSLHAARVMAPVAALPSQPDWEALAGDMRSGAPWTFSRLAALLFEAKPFLMLASLAAGAFGAGLVVALGALLALLLGAAPGVLPAIAAASLFVIATIVLVGGLVLGALARGRAEAMRVAFQREPRLLPQ